MDRRQIYAKTEEFVKGRWLSFMSVSIIAGIITSIITFVIFTFVIGPNIVLLELLPTMNLEETMSSLIVIFSSLSISATLSSIFSVIVKAGLEMSSLDAYVNGGKITLGSTFSKIKNNFVPIIVAGMIMLVINFVLSIFDFLSAFSLIIIPIISYMMIFTFFTLEDNVADNGVDAIKESYRRSNGHKFDLFIVQMNYSLKPLWGLLVAILGAFFVSVLPTLAALLMLTGFIVSVVLALKYRPYITMSLAVYYRELKVMNREIDEDIVDIEVVEEEII